MTIGEINITKTLEEVDKFLKEEKISPQMRSMVQLLVVVIKLLVAKLGLNSKNSSIPPSKDPNRTRKSSRKVKGIKRKPGGQKGHNGTTLQQVDNPDKIEKLRINRKSLPKGEYKECGVERRQVIDIKISRQVTEYQAEILEDSKGNKFVAEFPTGIDRPVQYGSSVKVQATYMSQYQLIPYERVRDYFADQCGIPISVGSIFNFNKEAFELLDEYEKRVKQHIINQELLHGDETGINVNGKLIWLHTISNSKWTLFFPHPKRGEDAMKEMGVLEKFEGILCHDHWKPYFKFKKCLHSLCNAHHLRELERAWEHDGQKWANKLQKLLLEIKDAVDKNYGALPSKPAKAFIKRYRKILAEGDRECPRVEQKDENRKSGRTAQSKSRNLLERLKTFETETLRFITDCRVPFTNNQGENDIRMTKVQQKISGCFRSFEGAQIFCRIRGYLSTCMKHDIAPIDALNMLFSGNLPSFLEPP
jgi:transposase